MSHGITQLDRAAYAVKAPWHFGDTGADGRATVYDAPMTLAEAVERSSISTHETVGEPLYVMRGGVYVSVPHKLLTNAADNSIEFATVGEDYALVQYRTLAEKLAPLSDKLGILWHAAGTLESGAKAWLSGQLPDEYSVVHFDGRADKHLDWLNAQFCHDTTYATSIYPVDFRTECANMLGMAQSMEKAHGTRVKMVGDAEARFGCAVENVVGQLEAIRERRSVCSELAQRQLNQGDASQFFAELLAETQGTRDRRDAVSATFVQSSPEKRAQLIEDLLAANDARTPVEAKLQREKLGVGKGLELPAKTANLFARRHSRLMELFAEGKGNNGSDAYDALNAVTEWVDHDGVASFRGSESTQAEKRFESAVAGDGAMVKQKAFELLTERVLVSV